jgi:membrane associated rhomboid family serine protease
MFIVLPMGVDYRARRYPVVTFTLMGICTAVYLVELICDFTYGFLPVTVWMRQNLWLTPDDAHWWTYITSLFVHAGFGHLAGNMIYLFLFGACVEDIIGRLRFTIFYFLCGLASTLTYIISVHGREIAHIPLGGASGAISGCIGGFLLLLMKRKINFRWFIYLWVRVWNGEFLLPAWLVISFWFLENLFYMILSLSRHHRGGGTAFAAHVGGTVFGMLIMVFEKIRLKRAGDDYAEEEIYEPIATMRPMAAVVAGPPVRQRVEQKRVFIVGEKETIHLLADGVQTGPFKNSVVQQRLVDGEIPADALYWQEGMADWRPVEELRAAAQASSE